PAAATWGCRHRTAPAPALAPASPGRRRRRAHRPPPPAPSPPAGPGSPGWPTHRRQGRADSWRTSPGGPRNVPAVRHLGEPAVVLFALAAQRVRAGRVAREQDQVVKLAPVAALVALVLLHQFAGI